METTISLPEKLPFRISDMLARVRRAVRPYPKAMLFELAERGYDSAFEQLCACVISIRAFDEISGPAALRLFARARRPRSGGRRRERCAKSRGGPCAISTGSFPATSGP